MTSEWGGGNGKVRAAVVARCDEAGTGTYQGEPS